MFNDDVRRAIKRYGFRGYEIAAALGVSESVFSRKLNRSELTAEQKQHIYEAIARLDEIRRAS